VIEDYVPSAQVLQLRRTMPSPKDAAVTVDLIAASRKPVILVGRVPSTVDPRDVCRLLDRDLPEDVGLILGSGQNVSFATMLFSEPRDLVVANQFFSCRPALSAPRCRCP
jgi:hypothetical protein